MGHGCPGTLQGQRHACKRVPVSRTACGQALRERSTGQAGLPRPRVARRGRPQIEMSELVERVLAHWRAAELPLSAGDGLAMQKILGRTVCGDRPVRRRRRRSSRVRFAGHGGRKPRPARIPPPLLKARNSRGGTPASSDCLQFATCVSTVPQPSE